MTTGSEVRKGLVGVVADSTAISTIDESTNSLLYRGYPVEELAASRSFEEVAYLIWHGELPSPTELEAFVASERARRELPDDLLPTLARLPLTCHPMDVLRSAVSMLGAADPAEDDASAGANLEKSLDLLAKLPAVVAAEQRRRRGESPIAPDPSLGFAEHFFHLCFGSVPEPEVVRAFEISLVLYAEHSFNASTFTARVVASTRADLHSAVTAAVGALKGPLHGGANEAVMAMLEEVGDAGSARAFVTEALAARRLVMGFGHRVYKHGDSRVPTMRAAFERLADLRGAHALLELYETLERAMFEATGIHPNLDYPTGPAYSLMGFDIPTFTPIFVLSRISGWTAHVIEQLGANALIRPLAAYAGPARRPVPPR